MTTSSTIKTTTTPKSDDRTAVFRRAELARYRSPASRSLAFGVLGVSIVGALLWGGGGVDAWRMLRPRLIGVSVAIFIQAVSTTIQWFFGGRDWYNPWYVGAVLASSSTSLAGYWPIVHPWLTGMFEIMEGQGIVGTYVAYYAPFEAGLLLVAAVLAADVFPERVLISD